MAQQEDDKWIQNYTCARLRVYHLPVLLRAGEQRRGTENSSCSVFTGTDQNHREVIPLKRALNGFIFNTAKKYTLFSYFLLYTLLQFKSL